MIEVGEAETVLVGAKKFQRKWTEVEKRRKIPTTIKNKIMPASRKRAYRQHLREKQELAFHDNEVAEAKRDCGGASTERWGRTAVSSTIIPQRDGAAFFKKQW